MSNLEHQEIPHHQLSKIENFLQNFENADFYQLNHVTDFLNKHQDLLTPEVIAQITEREKREAIEQYKIARQEGYANDHYQSKPGVKMYLTKEGKEHISNYCSHFGYPMNESDWQEVEENIWYIELPKGLFNAGGNGIQFYKDCENENESQLPFAAGYHQIIRIEGSGGKLWQNYNFTWDLKPKQKNS